MAKAEEKSESKDISPNSAKTIAKVMTWAIAIVLGVILAFYLLLKAKRGQEVVFQNSVTTHTIWITKQYGSLVKAGIPWRVMRDDVSFIVEYHTTKLGIVTETFPAIKYTPPGWKPLYPSIEATGVRFKLTKDSGLAAAEMMLYE